MPNVTMPNVTLVRRRLHQAADDLRHYTHPGADLSVALATVGAADDAIGVALDELQDLDLTAVGHATAALVAVMKATMLLVNGHNRSVEVPDTVRAYLQVARHEALEALWRLDDIDGGWPFAEPAQRA